MATEELRAPRLGLVLSSRGGSLLTRVARLLGQPETPDRPMGGFAEVFSLVLVTAAGVPSFCSERFGPHVEAEKANRRVREALKAVTAISFADAHFDFVRGYLGDVHRIPLEFDASVRERFQDLGQVRITIHVEGEDLETVLQRVLHGPQLSYFVEAGTLWIATPEEVKRRGHPIPRSFAALLSQLHAIADKVPWERLLLGRQPDAVEAPQQTASQVEQLTKLLSHGDAVVRRWFGAELGRVQQVVAFGRILATSAPQSRCETPS